MIRIINLLKEDIIMSKKISLFITFLLSFCIANIIDVRIPKLICIIIVAFILGCLLTFYALNYKRKKRYNANARFNAITKAAGLNEGPKSPKSPKRPEEK